mmetsp:Transcript_2792/g.5126  ORF Transcript_2792/g.5126 Transcript_2792/m.5126 type:complete len:365 (-) Transcript_2792:247-1341(-)
MLPRVELWLLLPRLELCSVPELVLAFDRRLLLWYRLRLEAEHTSSSRSDSYVPALDIVQILLRHHGLLLLYHLLHPLLPRAARRGVSPADIPGIIAKAARPAITVDVVDVASAIPPRPQIICAPGASGGITQEGIIERRSFQQHGIFIVAAGAGSVFGQAVRHVDVAMGAGRGRFGMGAAAAIALIIPVGQNSIQPAVIIVVVIVAIHAIAAVGNVIVRISILRRRRKHRPTSTGRPLRTLRYVRFVTAIESRSSLGGIHTTRHGRLYSNEIGKVHISSAMIVIVLRFMFIISVTPQQFIGERTVQRVAASVSADAFHLSFRRDLSLSVMPAATAAAAPTCRLRRHLSHCSCRLGPLCTTVVNV